MSRHETWRTRKYWESVGGLLIEEFCVIRKGVNNGTRLIDGVIVLGESTKLHDSNFYDIRDKDVICIQTKQSRLGMYLMGQAFFSAELLKRYFPKSIKKVLICGKDDEILNPICMKFDIEVVIIPESEIGQLYT
ncbi:MAG: hypothetical protein J0M37_09680 [Ignavibacteria bacterium]|nr:hypothetical protein [Ignavibacteria bacterium]